VFRFLQACCLLAFVAAAIGACATPQPRFGLQAEYVLVEPDLQSPVADHVAYRAKSWETFRIATATPLRIGFVERGIAEFQAIQPTFGAALLRAPPQAEMLLVPYAAQAQVFRMHIRDPGYGWFELEEQAVHWAGSRLGTPFPEIAAPARSARDSAEILDAALARAGVSTERFTAAVALRRLLALRVIENLRPPAGRPYYRTQDLALPGAPVMVDERDAFYPIAGAVPLDVTGPATLRLFAREHVPIAALQDRDAGTIGGGAPAVAAPASAPLTVYETVESRLAGIPSRRLRGRVEPLARATPLPSLVDAGANLRILEHVTIHVPSGLHHYVLEPDVDQHLLIRAERAVSIRMLQNAWKMDVAALEAEVTTLCSSYDDASEMCALSRALTGNESVTQTRAESPALTLAKELSEGGPKEPRANSEERVRAGDMSALLDLQAERANELDEAVRHSATRALEQGTAWFPVREEVGAEALWFSSDPPVNVPQECTALPATPGEGGAARSIDTQLREFGTQRYRGLRVLEVHVVTTCAVAPPIVLNVDGERVAFQPTSEVSRVHIAVRKPRATVQRLDNGTGTLWIAESTKDRCPKTVRTFAAPIVLADERVLDFGTHRAPPGSGLEFWIQEGAGSQHAGVQVGASSAFLDALISPPMARPVLGSDSGSAVQEPKPRSAVDAHGRRWVHAGTWPVDTGADGANPASATGPIRVRGTALLAVRAVVRSAKVAAGLGLAVPAVDPIPLDEGVLAKLSAEILRADVRVRGEKLRARAFLLARAGAERAALEDASAADLLGTTGANGERLVDAVRAALAPWEARALALAPDQAAFGMESAFDTPRSEVLGKATEPARWARCSVSASGARAQVEALELAFKLQAKSVYDPALFGRAAALAREYPTDPRVARLTARAMLGSRWQLRRDLSGKHIALPEPTAGLTSPLESDGLLRARVALGTPFGAQDYAVVSSDRAARANLSIAAGTPAHVEFLCAARKPSAADAGSCPVEIRALAGVLLPRGAHNPNPPIGRLVYPATPVAYVPGSVVRVDIPRGLPRNTVLEFAVAPTAGEVVVAVRVVFDWKVAGSLRLPDRSGFVLPNLHVQYRLLVERGSEVRFPMPNPGYLQFDIRPAVPLPIGRPLVAELPRVLLSASGADQEWVADEAPRLLAVTRPGEIRIRPLGASVTISVQERIADPDASGPTLELTRLPTAEIPAGVFIRSANDGFWRDQLQAAPEPLSALAERLGTLVLSSGVTASSLREATRGIREPDAFASTALTLRRTIESASLTLAGTALLRIRNGAPTFGAQIFGYENLYRLHLRAMASAALFVQDVDGSSERSLKPRAFVESNLRISDTFSILPRLGFDGYYTSAQPKVLRNVDDDVFNRFRAERSSLLYAQGLFWLAPHFNDVFYARLRAELDAGSAQVSHASSRAGVLLAFGPVEFSGVYALAWHRQTARARATSGFDSTAFVAANGTFWLSKESFGLQPAVAVSMRDDGSIDGSLSVGVLLSARRGLRDYSAFELNFPDHTSGAQ
jgi:hypothetical protein